MIALHPEYIIDQKERKKSVIIPFKEWERLMYDIEELEDIRAYDIAKADNDKTISFEEAIKELEK